MEFVIFNFMLFGNNIIFYSLSYSDKQRGYPTFTYLCFTKKQNKTLCGFLSFVRNAEWKKVISNTGHTVQLSFNTGLGKIRQLTQLIYKWNLSMYFSTEMKPIQSIPNRVLPPIRPVSTQGNRLLATGLLCTTTLNRPSWNMLNFSRYFCIQTFYFGKIIQLHGWVLPMQCSSL